MAEIYGTCGRREIEEFFKGKAPSDLCCNSSRRKCTYGLGFAEPPLYLNFLC